MTNARIAEVNLLRIFACVSPIEQIAKKEDELINYATALTGCRHEAKDVIQETYLRLLKHNFQPNFDVDKYAGTIKMIIKQVFISKKRKDATKQRAIENYEETAIESVTEKELRQVLGEFLWSLDKYDRYLLYLRAIEGYGIIKMETITSISRGSIQYSLWKIKQKIRELPLRKKQVLKKALRKKSNL